jgi:predicted PurR-regulated permease PerM
VSSVRTGRQDRRRLVVESAALGLGYVAVLIWIGSALVGSFGYDGANPYWPAVPHLRTDTAGAIAFLVAIVTLVLSRYLELRRRSDAPTEPAPRSAGVLTVQAVAETAAILGTALVIYLSCNAFMHPETLRMQLTHLLPWPSEGTVRVIALAICLVSVATRRYLRATATRPRQAAVALEKADVTA